MRYSTRVKICRILMRICLPKPDNRCINHLLVFEVKAINERYWNLIQRYGDLDFSAFIPDSIQQKMPSYKMAHPEEQKQK